MNKDAKIIIIIAVLSLGLIGSSVWFLGRSSSSNTPAKTDEKLLVREDSFKIASSSAKITLVEFSDFQCPACAVAQPEVSRILSDYQGKINFVYRHFPLPQHPKAIPAAVAAEAAGKQGKFIQMGDQLFLSQDEWANSDSPDELFIKKAIELGLDQESFKKDLNDPKLLEKVKRDYQDAVVLKIDATPTFFVEGEKMVGVPSYEQFKQMIDSKITP